jgi:GGDEF domain-containing protein
MDEDFRVLTPEAFEFVLTNELKRAVRSQNYLTLLLVEPSLRDGPRGGDSERERLVRQVAGLAGREIRETDLLAQTEPGRLSIVLLDADLQSAMRVVERLTSRFEHYQFPRPIEIEIGAACCPTHGVDAASLRDAAEAGAVHRRRDPRGNASNAQ